VILISNEREVFCARTTRKNARVPRGFPNFKTRAGTKRFAGSGQSQRHRASHTRYDINSNQTRPGSRSYLAHRLHVAQTKLAPTERELRLPCFGTPRQSRRV